MLLCFVILTINVDFDQLVPTPGHQAMTDSALSVPAVLSPHVTLQQSLWPLSEID